MVILVSWQVLSVLENKCGNVYIYRERECVCMRVCEREREVKKDRERGKEV